MSSGVPRAVVAVHAASKDGTAPHRCIWLRLRWLPLLPGAE